MTVAGTCCSKTLVWFNYPEFYDEIAATPGMNRLVEVGCWRGGSMRHLAKRLVECGRPFQLWGVDIWEHWDYKVAGIKTSYADYNRALTEAGVRNQVTDIVLPSIEAAKQFSDATLDFVFLDADHRPLAVLDDICAWRPKIRPGGVLAGHDYSDTVSGKWSDPDYENVCWAVCEAVKSGVLPSYSVRPNTVWMSQL